MSLFSGNKSVQTLDKQRRGRTIFQSPLNKLPDQTYSTHHRSFCKIKDIWSRDILRIKRGSTWDYSLQFRVPLDFNI